MCPTLCSGASVASLALDAPSGPPTPSPLDTASCRSAASTCPDDSLGYGEGELPHDVLTVSLLHGNVTEWGDLVERYVENSPDNIHLF